MNAATRTSIGRLLLGLMVLVLAACQPATPTAPPTAPPATAAPTQAPTQAPATVAPTQPPATGPPTEAAEPVTLQVWFLSGSTQEIEIITAQMDAYEAAHPGATIELRFY